MQQLILIIHVLVAVSLIALVLLQQGKGSDIGAAFGSGASNTMFGSAGATPFLMKVTGVMAAIFFATSLALSYFAVPHNRHGGDVTSDAVVPTIPMPASSTPNPASIPTGTPPATN